MLPLPSHSQFWPLLLVLALASTNALIAARQPLHQLLSKPRGGGTTTRSKPPLPKEHQQSFTDIVNAGEIIAHDPSENRGPLRVLFLSSDTGGGHRASAESLAKQFLIHFPGSTYDLLDVWTQDGVWPYRTLVESYKHLSAHPNQWRVLYHFSNARPWEILTDLHSTMACEKKIRQRIDSYNPDVIVSVHPAMQYVPLIATQNLSKQHGKHIPFFTVVTDLASAHSTWFQKNVDKMYVASNRLRQLARRRGSTPSENIILSGLPIRHDFAVQAENMRDRTTPLGQTYQAQVKAELGIDSQRPMVLVMGGGEGVGGLGAIVEELYTAFTKNGVDATICVVCGRNEKLKHMFETRDWDKVLAKDHRPRKRNPLARLFAHRRTKKIQDAIERAELLEGDDAPTHGKVQVVPLGFVTRMAEYMVAADILVTKAGPGTIAEAAAVGLPVMLTSFLPGQEAGNVDYVLDHGFGDFCKDPVMIGNEVACWLQDRSLLETMSRNAQQAGHPHAAADIVLDIGKITHTWMALNAVGRS